MSMAMEEEEQVAYIYLVHLVHLVLVHLVFAQLVLVQLILVHLVEAGVHKCQWPGRRRGGRKRRS